MSAPEKGLIRELRDVVGCMRQARADFRLLGVAALFSALQVVLNLYIVSLLFPLADALIRQEFSAVAKVPIIQYALPYLPPELQGHTALFSLLVAWLYVCILLRAIMSFIAAFVVRIQAEMAVAALRMMMLERYFTFGKGYFDKRNPERIRSKISLCTSWMKRQLTAFHEMLSDLLKLAAYLAVMIYISWELSLALALVMPIVTFISHRLVIRLKGLAMGETNAMEKINLATVRVMSRMPLVLACGKKVRELRQLAALGHEQFSIARKMHRVESMVSPFQEIGLTTGQLVMAFAMAWIAPASLLEPGRILVFFYLGLNVIPLFNSFNRFRLRIVAHANGKDRLESVMNDEEKFFIQGGTRPFEGNFRSIEFNHLSFAYGSGKKVFNDLSFTLPAGKVTALVGATGAGKTTIAYLLLRLYDCAPDTMRIDGVDVHEYELDSLRRSIAFVEQQPIILDDTLRANLCYGLEGPPDDAALLPMLKHMQLDRLVSSLPQGLDTLIGEGAQLSGGERQRIALCRALLMNAPILILDEATSALDPGTEEVLMESVVTAARGKTVLLISHRLSTVAHADHVLVLENGKIVQSGSVAEISAQEGAFTRCFGLHPGQHK